MTTAWNPPPAAPADAHDAPAGADLTAEHPAWHRRHDSAVWGPMSRQHNPLLDHAPGSDPQWQDSHTRSFWQQQEREHPAAHAGAVRAMHKYLQGAHLALSLEDPALHSVLDDGGVHSAFVTNTTGTYQGSRMEDYLDERRKVEHLNFGYPHDHPDYARPIYGYLTHHPFTDAGTGRYGAHTLVLSRPALAHRTTWNLGDSLNSQERVRASHLTAPRTDSMAHTQLGGSLPGGRFLPVDQRVRRTLRAPSEYSDDGYVEAHVHGGVDLRHIHYAVLRSFDPADRQRTRELGRHLTAAGIPWVHTTGWAPPSRALDMHAAERIHVAILDGALVAEHHPDVNWHDHGHRYIIELAKPGRHGLPSAQVADIARGILHPPTPLDSILARGYWHRRDQPVDAEDVLPLVRP